eukprot:95110-Chlamydomonas_euryale.AAC.1
MMRNEADRWWCSIGDWSLYSIARLSAVLTRKSLLTPWVPKQGGGGGEGGGSGTRVYASPGCRPSCEEVLVDAPPCGARAGGGGLRREEATQRHAVRLGAAMGRGGARRRVDVLYRGGAHGPEPCTMSDRRARGPGAMHHE